MPPARHNTRQFYQADFVEQLSQILSYSGINPAKLKLELTENPDTRRSQ
jgi:EAL domain-containing protein (putative c-di-GMP-specific phosphodiesterase class I)